jgi:hypothetical protein
VQIGLAQIEWLNGNHQQAKALFLIRKRVCIIGKEMSSNA